MSITLSEKTIRQLEERGILSKEEVPAAPVTNPVKKDFSKAHIVGKEGTVPVPVKTRDEILTRRTQ